MFPNRILRGTEGKVGFEGYGSTANQYGRKSGNMGMMFGGLALVSAGLAYYLYQSTTTDAKEGSAKPAVRG